MRRTENLSKEVLWHQIIEKEVIHTNNLYLLGKVEAIEYSKEMKECLDDFKSSI